MRINVYQRIIAAINENKTRILCNVYMEKKNLKKRKKEERSFFKNKSLENRF